MDKGAAGAPGAGAGGGDRLMAAYQVEIIYAESGGLTRLVLPDPP